MPKTIATAVAEPPAPTAPAAPPASPVDIVGTAVAEAQAERAAEVEANKAHREHQFALYAAILSRADHPEVDDRTYLRQLVVDLGLTPAKVAEDQETIKAALHWQEVLSRREAIVAERNAAAVAKQETEKRCRSEVEAAARRYYSATAEHQTMYVDAPSRLRVLAAERPALFDRTVDPPRLRVAAPTTK